jgi:Protein of unknown function (DUF3037)
MIVQYSIIKYTPNVVRDESVNVGVIAREPSTGRFDYKFLRRSAVVRKIWPSADTQVVGHLERALAKTRTTTQLSLVSPSLGRTGSPSDPDFFAKARREFTGNLQLSVESAMETESLEDALQWAYNTFVAEPAVSARPINYQALAPFQTRARLWRAFERRNLIGPKRVRERAVFQGVHAPWTFDLAYKNDAQHLINSVALNAGAEANLGRALVFKGMLDEVAKAGQTEVYGIAVIQWPKASAEETAADKAVAILDDAGIETHDVGNLEQLVERVEKDLAHV